MEQHLHHAQRCHDRTQVGRLETYGGKLVENIVHAVARNLLVKPIEAYHQVKRCSVNEFISGGAVDLGETTHRVPVSGQAVVVQSRQQRLGMLGSFTRIPR